MRGTSIIFAGALFSFGTTASAAEPAHAIADAMGKRQTDAYVEKFVDKLKPEPRCERHKTTLRAAKEKGTVLQGTFVNAFMAAYEEAKKDGCVKPDAINGLK